MLRHSEIGRIELSGKSPQFRCARSFRIEITAIFCNLADRIVPFFRILTGHLEHERKLRKLVG